MILETVPAGLRVDNSLAKIFEFFIREFLVSVHGKEKIGNFLQIQSKDQPKFPESERISNFERYLQ